MHPRSARAVLAALAGVALLLAWSWASRPFGDFGREAGGATAALGRLDLGGFFALAPAYGGSILLRAPFAVLAEATGAGTTGRYVWLALPAMAALGWFAWLVAGRLRGQPPLVWLAAVALVTLNPLAHEALALGHAEELLVGVACIGAVLAAGDDRPALAGLLLGLAVGAKPWAVIAGPPVLWATRDLRQAAVVAAASLAAAGAVVVPFLLLAGGTVRSTTSIATGNGGISTPFSVWYLVDQGRAAWVGRISHPLAVAGALGLPVALALAGRRRRRDALLVLALALLVRCLLDTWTRDYYPLPALLALLGFEALVLGRAPLLAGGLTCALTLALVGPLGTTASWLVYVVATGATLGWGLRALRPGAIGAAAQPATPAIASTASA